MQKNLKKQCLKTFYAVSECFYVMHVISLFCLDREYLQLCCSWKVGLASLFSTFSSLFRSVLLLDSPFTAGCSMTIIPTSFHSGLYCGCLLFHQSNVTLNWIERNQTALLPVPIFNCFSFWEPFGSLHSNNKSITAVESSSCPAQYRQSIVGGCLFCTECYQCLIPEINSALHFNFQQMKESYPVERYFLPLSLLAVTSFFVKWLEKESLAFYTWTIWLFPYFGIGVYHATLQTYVLCVYIY